MISTFRKWERKTTDNINFQNLTLQKRPKKKKKPSKILQKSTKKASKLFFFFFPFFFPPTNTFATRKFEETRSVSYNLSNTNLWDVAGDHLYLSTRALTRWTPDPWQDESTHTQAHTSFFFICSSDSVFHWKKMRILHGKQVRIGLLCFR